MIEKVNLFKEFVDSGKWEPFEDYEVLLKVSNMVGGLPMNPDLVETWVNATNMDKSTEERAVIRDAHLKELDDVVDEVLEMKGIGFARVDGNLAIEGRQLKSMLKEGANIIKAIVPGNLNLKAKGKGVPALKSKIADQVFVMADYVWPTRGDVKISEVDEVRQHPINVMTMRGMRSAIKVMEILKNFELKFTIRRFLGGVSLDTILAILQYGQEIGIGASRAMGYGRFTIKTVESCGRPYVKSQNGKSLNSDVKEKGK